MMPAATALTLKRGTHPYQAAESLHGFDLEYWRNDRWTTINICIVNCRHRGIDYRLDAHAGHTRPIISGIIDFIGSPGHDETNQCCKSPNPTVRLNYCFSGP
jgi:hypothetical protein